MAVIEDAGEIIVHGRFGGLQVPVDSLDTEVAIPTGATHAEVQQGTQFQEVLYSITGLVDSWFVLPPSARDSVGTSFRVALSGAAGVDPNRKIYFRKSRLIRQISFRPLVSGRYVGLWDATTNIPILADGTGYAGLYYEVSVGGTQDLGSGPIVFVAGDWIIHDGSVWDKATEDPRAGICDDVIGNLAVTFTVD